MTTIQRIRPETALQIGGPSAVRAAAGEVAGALAARAADHDREGSFPHEGIEAIWQAGLGNLTLPAALGGVGAGLESTAEAVALLAAGDPAAALVLVMHLSHVPLLATPAGGAPPDLCSVFVASTIAGPALANALRVEPELGSPARGGVPATRARRAGDGWAISGRKIFSTGAPGLRWLLVWGATADDDPDGMRVGWFAVPGDADGLSIDETWDHLGMRASGSHDVVLDDVRIPLGHAFGLAAPGTSSGRDATTAASLLVLLLAVYLGVAQAARDWLVAYLHERAPANLGAPLATLPRFQTAVGEIEARLVASRRLLAGLARDLDAGGAPASAAGVVAPLLKTTIARDLIAAVSTAVELVGNAGLTRHHPLQRHLRDVLCSRIHTPQEDAVLLVAGRAALAQTQGA